MNFKSDILKFVFYKFFVNIFYYFCSDTHIHIYIYIERERERVGKIQDLPNQPIYIEREIYIDI